MKTPYRILTCITFCSLLLTLCFGLAGHLTPITTASAQEQQTQGGGEDERPSHQGLKVSEKLRDKASRRETSEERVEVILQLNGKMSGGLNALLNRNGVHVRKELKKLGMAVVELPANAVNELAAFDEVSYVSSDEQTQVLGHVTRETGVDAAVAQKYSSITKLDGTGVGIAIIDSGIMDAHSSFLDYAGTTRRVIHNENFVTTENRTDDPYGHGTHVAGLAAGYDRTGGGAYSGVAPDAKLIDLRVLDSMGNGKSSWLLAALDWIAANYTTYNIRVVNMSLGAPARDSWTNDPVCIAVQKLDHLGIVFVAAAGNNGKSDAGQKFYGAIHTPGVSPHAITVGALNTFGTDTRTGDTIDSYSSRGPTRGYWTDSYGRKNYDNILKPDMVAPGNKLISAASSNNNLRTSNPSLVARTDSTGQNDMMYLSGTSMSAPLVTGTVALMLEVNPKLTPYMVRSILQYTAVPVKGYNLLEQGAGQLNVAGAMKLADLVRRDLAWDSTTPVGTSLLTAAVPTPSSILNGVTYTWGQGITFEQTYGMGLDLISKFQEGYRIDMRITNDLLVSSNGTLVKDTSKLTSGITIGRNILTSSGGLLSNGTAIAINLRGNGVLLSDGVMLSDGVLMSDGVLLSDGVLMSDGTLMSDGVLLGDTIIGTSVLVRGDNTACMPVAP